MKIKTESGDWMPWVLAVKLCCEIVMFLTVAALFMREPGLVALYCLAKEFRK